MLLDIYGQFIVGVARPSGGWSKGRPIVYIEEEDKCVPVFDLLVPGGLDDAGIARFVIDRFSAFARPGRRVARLQDPSSHAATTAGAA